MQMRELGYQREELGLTREEMEWSREELARQASILDKRFNLDRRVAEAAAQPLFRPGGGSRSGERQNLKFVNEAAQVQDVHVHLIRGEAKLIDSVPRTILKSGEEFPVAIKWPSANADTPIKLGFAYIDAHGRSTHLHAS
jgi:hypothetical protein